MILKYLKQNLVRYLQTTNKQNFYGKGMILKMDKRFEHDYIRRWRVIAMLENIKTHLNDNKLPQIVDNYIKFSKEIDEYKWELENR